MCLCFTFIREGLRGVEQRLVLHGVLVHNWHVQLRKGDVTYYDTLDSCRLHFLPPQVNLSNTPTTTKELKVWLNNVSTTDPVGPRPMLLHIAPIQLPLCVCASREWPPTLHLLFIEWECTLLSEHSNCDHSRQKKWNVKMWNVGLTFLLNHLNDTEGLRGKWWATIRHSWLWSRWNLQGLVLLSC